MILIKDFRSILLITLIGLNFSGVSKAALFDRGGGMIYDDVLDVTWLQDANYAKTSGYDADGLMTWNAAKTWADNLSFGGYNDWRLPDVQPINGGNFNTNFSNDGSTDTAYNITSTRSELANLFYVSLGNDGFRDASGALSGCSSVSPFCLTNSGPFINLQPSIYFFGVDITSIRVWVFNFGSGFQSVNFKNNSFYAWAVRSGDVVAQNSVPSPAPVWLVSIGLLLFRGGWQRFNSFS